MTHDGTEEVAGGVERHGVRLGDAGSTELTLTEMARATGLTLSAAYRLATTLVDGGFLARDEGSERYRLGIGDGRNVVVLVCVESQHALRFDRPPGTLVPVHISAMGKALLAFGAEPPAAAVKAIAPLERFTATTLTSQRALVAELEATRDRGYALVDEEQMVGVRSIAAIGIQGPASRIGDDRIPEMATAVSETARAVEVLTERGFLL